MKDFAKIAKSLSDLTSKKLPNKIVWTNEHQEAFNAFKEAIRLIVLCVYLKLKNPLIYTVTVTIVLCKQY